MAAISRRKFVTGAAAGGAAVVSSLACAGGDKLPRLGENCAPPAYSLPLTGHWLFRTAAQGQGMREGWFEVERPVGGWTEVSVPHTWQVTDGLEEYAGKAWYRCLFEAPELCEDSWVRLEFEAVYHSAVVWLGGVRIGEHLRKGYTAFTVDLSGNLKPGEANVLAVEVDNAFDNQMLPRGTSFDWNRDGGIIRPVNLLVTPRIFIESLRVDSRPRLDAGDATLGIGVRLRNCLATTRPVEIGYEIREHATGQVVLSGKAAAKADVEAGASLEVALPEAVLPDPVLWHFDNPHLYIACVELSSGGELIHRDEAVFGIRSFEVRGGKFYLNGEPVRLMGVERMAGSNPLFGMAEPIEWIEHDHKDLKELNCVYTRVHWQQDRRVLDYCDRHGIMIQLEVPTWGPDTFSDMPDGTDPEIMDNGLEQLREMIGRDRNHPSVVAWGLCNEIGGQYPPAYSFAERMLEEAKKLDPQRPCTYASNSLQQSPGKDVAGLMDFIEWNEYYESWYNGGVEEMENNLREIHEAFPGKPIVISEYGYCQCRPERTEGDRRAREILKTHTRAYRRYPFVGGAIFFSYNDYRTHIGDKGLGAYKQRVHGVVDLLGNRKRSFHELRLESSPVEKLTATFRDSLLHVHLQTRNTLPAYTLTGYSLSVTVYAYDNLPLESHAIDLDEIEPGGEFSAYFPVVEKHAQQIRVDVMRPTGFSARTAWWKA